MGCCWSSSPDNPYVDSDPLGPAALTTKSTQTQSSTGTSSNSRSSARSGGYDSSSRNLAGNSTPSQYPRFFSFSDLKVATKNFRNDYVLGEGGFGKVYKGWIDSKIGNSGSIVAVKKLRAESMQGFQEWQSEVKFLGKLSHAHLVTLIGYCCEDNELLLVYEFMQRGSLENHLFGRGAAGNPLPWETRLQILTGAARGLAFLHSLDRKVIYRDFKASNILLDGSYNAKISDFGLAKMGPSSSQSHVTTQVMGTHGYAAPEYIATGHLYVKSDVYGFGVVVVEMLTGLRALDVNRPLNQQNLIDWVKPHLSNRRKLMKLMDSHLEGKYPSRSAMQVAQLALSCLASEPKNRPSMQDIVDKLEEIASDNEKPGMQRVHIGSQQGRSSGNTTPARQLNLPQRSPRQQVMNSPLPLPPKSYR